MASTGNVSEAVRRFYERVATTDRITDLEIPHSHVYFTRWHIWEKTGKWFNIDHVQISMWLEGMVHYDDLKAIPEWYVKKFMGGVQPNMEELRAKSKELYLKHQEENNS